MVIELQLQYVMINNYLARETYYSLSYDIPKSNIYFLMFSF